MHAKRRFIMKFEKLLESYTAEEVVLLEGNIPAKLVKAANELINTGASMEEILKNLSAKHDRQKYQAAVWALPVKVGNKQYDTVREAAFEMVKDAGPDSLDYSIWDNQVAGSFKDAEAKKLFNKLLNAAKTSRSQRDGLTTGATALHNDHLARYIQAAVAHFIKVGQQSFKDKKLDARARRKAARGPSAKSAGGERRVARNVKKALDELGNTPDVQAAWKNVQSFYEENDYALNDAVQVGMALGLALGNKKNWKDLIKTHVVGDE